MTKGLVTGHVAQSESVKDENKNNENKVNGKISKENSPWDHYEVYTKKGQVTVPKVLRPSDPLSVDKGTAIETTVNVTRKAFDAIVSATTYGEGVQWEELGVDENKRWVVINGQRFECEHSPEEKAARKRAQMTLMDYLEEVEKNKNEKKDPKKDPGNLDALKNNKTVMDLIKSISGMTTEDGAIEWLQSF